MKSIVEEKLVSFKSLEQKVFAYVCELGREITRIMLENYDAELAEERDKSQYRDKGKRTTTIKTVYGEVTYARRVYRTKLDDGRNACVYLLDEAMHMDKIGLISTNLAEKDSHDSYRMPLPCNSRYHQRNLRPEYQPWRCMEPGAKARRADQGGRRLYRKADGSRAGGRESRDPGAV